MSQLSHMYTFHHSHIHSSKKFVHGWQSPQLALQFMALQLWSLFCSSSVWSPSLILFFTNALALPVTALYTITQPLEAGLQLFRVTRLREVWQAEGRLRFSHVILVPMLCNLQGASLSRYSTMINFPFLIVTGFFYSISFLWSRVPAALGSVLVRQLQHQGGTDPALFFTADILKKFTFKKFTPPWIRNFMIPFFSNFFGRKPVNSTVSILFTHV